MSTRLNNFFESIVNSTNPRYIGTNPNFQGSMTHFPHAISSTIGSMVPSFSITCGEPMKFGDYSTKSKLEPIIGNSFP